MLFKILIFWIVWAKNGPKCQKTSSFALYILKWQKIMSVTPYLSKHTSFDCAFCCTSLKWWHLQMLFRFRINIVIREIRSIFQSSWYKFLHLVKISQYQSIIKFLIPRQRNKNFFRLLLKNKFQDFLNDVFQSFSSQLISTKLVIFI